MIAQQQRRLRWLIAAAVTCASLQTAQASDGDVPTLLQFAEKYQGAQPPAAAPAKAPEVRPHNPAPAAAKPVSNSENVAAYMQLKDAQIRQQRDTITELQNRLQSVQLALDKAQQPALPPAELTALKHFFKGVRQTLGITPPERQLQEQLIAVQRAEQAHITEREQLAEQITALKQQVSDQSKAMNALQALVAEPFDDSVLNDARKRQDYAAGVSLGEEINQLQAEHARWGIESDKKLLLAGISDTFEKRVRLPQEKVVEALTEINQQLDQKRNAQRDIEQKKADVFMADFKMQPGAEQLANGIWQRVEHIGDDPIADNDIIDVVIRETLADGEVVQDMELHNKVLSQPRQAFPAIFRDALGQLHNHGSMTIVVPPELAYGDAGYPPSVPPGASMIYHLRIADAHAPLDEKNNLKENAL